MTHKHKNFSRQPLQANDGDVFEDCNFSQDAPSTVISTAKNLTFRGCNLTRCAIDPTWIIEDCNTANHPKEPEITVDPVDEEIQQAVDKIAELSFKYPDKVSAKLKDKVDRPTTQGLLSADGATVEIVEKTGKWKAE